ncbi:Subtilase family [Dehalogenimonas alkenigignens]|uniref:Subtilase family n=1 Tax=Dehalogenimonas alkenigignens TaxID=1217799 RepID=A0A0W0GK95_9CHLR|nr:S8 family serine peptidase [Dehalogenimonas alkenigignens]KTB48989.1 Subtilase family [Dehalogenimonas alkenigignens]
MRYAIIPKGKSLTDIEVEAKKIGARNLKKAEVIGQVFCELDQAQAEKLAAVPGLVLKLLKEYGTSQMTAQAPPAESISDVFYLLRGYFTPAITGTGLTVAVLDSGVRKTHRSLQGKVVYEANFTESPTAADVFGHGTQVAFTIAGGMHALGENAGVSPGASIMNIKVIGDEGIASDEAIVLGIDRVCDLAEQARTSGLLPTDDLYPNVINLSLGGEDDGDPDNPVRVACRMASVEYGLDVIAAAGNTGPKMTTVMLPACEPEVIAVGAVETFGELLVWERSSRGPTVQGETKPDFVIWGTNLEMASDKNDEDFLVKSGTSFAAPMLAGLTGLLWESGRRAYGEGWGYRWTAAREVAPCFSTKPQDAPLGKDNAYGYGLPAMGAMLGQVMSSASPNNQTTEMVQMMTAMMMMAGVMGAI